MTGYAQGPYPYLISVPEDEIFRLKEKLASIRFPDELEEAEWDYGVPLADAKRLITRWREGYNWREHEERLNNALPQFLVDIPVEGFGTLNIHFVHKRSNVKDSIPILFVHGCEYYTNQYTMILTWSVRARKLY